MPISRGNLKEVVDSKEEPIAILFGDPCKAIFLKTYLEKAIGTDPRNPSTRARVSKADIITINPEEYTKVLGTSKRKGLSSLSLK